MSLTCKECGAIMRCGVCGGWGYTDESDHDFRIRMMEAVKGSAAFTLLMPDETFPVAIASGDWVAIPCEHGEYLTCINCDTAHSTPEGSA